MPDGRSRPPLPPPPRQLRWIPGELIGVGCGRIVILPHVLIGLIMLVLVPIRVGIQVMGHPVAAVVDEAGFSKGHGKSGGSYHVRFHYTLDGTRHEDRQQVTEAESKQWRVGDPLTGQAMVIFGHAVCLTNAGSTTRQTLFFAGFALFWNGVVSVFVYALWVAPWKTRRLLETGVAVAGEVIGERRFRSKSGMNAKVRYRFQGPTGPVEATMLVQGKALQRIEASRPITVVYDPVQPRRNMVFEYSGYALRPMVG